MMKARYSFSRGSGEVSPFSVFSTKLGIYLELEYCSPDSESDNCYEREGQRPTHREIWAWTDELASRYIAGAQHRLQGT